MNFVHKPNHKFSYLPVQEYNTLTDIPDKYYIITVLVQKQMKAIL